MYWKDANIQRNLRLYSFFFIHCFPQKNEMELDEWDHKWPRVPHRTWLIGWDLPLELEHDYEHDFLKRYQLNFFYWQSISFAYSLWQIYLKMPKETFSSETYHLPILSYVYIYRQLFTLQSQLESAFCTHLCQLGRAAL